MSTIELTISTLSFVLNSVLLSGFIIPQVQSQKSIKDKIAKFELTMADQNPFKKDPKSEQLEKETAELNKLLDIYRIRAVELDAVVRYFFYAIVVAAVAVTLLLVAGAGIAGSLIAVAHFIFQLSLLFRAIYLFAIRPDRLQEMSYLVGKLGLNPHTIVRAAEWSLNITDRSAGERTKVDDPLSIFLSFKLKVFGFRYLYVVSGEDRKIYFVAFGPVQGSSDNVFHHLMPPNDIWKSGEYNDIELGRFRFNVVEKAQKLNGDLMIFIPIFSHEELSPLYTRHNIEVYGREGSSKLSGQGGGQWPVSMRDQMAVIRYSGEGLRVNKLAYVGDDEKDVMARVVNKYGRRIRSAKKAEQHGSIAGDLI